jgi:hypothetical protein
MQDESNELRYYLESRLATANRNARRYRYLHISLVLLTLISGVLATTLAADSALGTKTLSNTVAIAGTGKEPSELPKGWKIVCGVIAVLTLTGTISQGVHDMLKISEHQSKSMDCAGKLDALTVELAQARGDKIESVRAELARVST